MFHLLAIGNSFSEDATYYLHQIGEAAGIPNQVVNLHIGGCPLERHWRKIESNAREYQFQHNGVKTERYLSVEDALRETRWDAIVTQQASHDSGWQDTYEPFLGLMLDYLRREAPEAKVYLHETWAYEADSTHPNFMRYHRDQQEMVRRVRDVYRAMADKHGLPLIPSGEMLQRLRATPPFADGRRTVCRDGFHVHYLYGRYALGCMWARVLWGVTLEGNAYVPRTPFLPFEEADAGLILAIQRLADAMA